MPGDNPCQASQSGHGGHGLTRPRPERGLSRAAGSALLTLALVTEPGLVFAHNIRPARALTVQVDDESIVLLWNMEMVGVRAELLVATWNLDGNPNLSDPEKKAVAVTLLSKARQGVSILCNGAGLTDGKLETRLQGEGRRTVGLMAWGLEEVPACAPVSAPGGGSRRIVVSLAQESGPLRVTVQTLGACRLRGQSSLRIAADGRGLAESVTLEAGTTLEVSAVGCAPRPQKGPKEH